MFSVSIAVTILGFSQVRYLAWSMKFLSQFCGLFLENTKQFFLLFWQKSRWFVLIAIMSSGAISYYVKSVGNLPLAISLCLFAGIAYNTAQLRKQLSLPVYFIVQPLGGFSQAQRFVFYWNIIGILGVWSGIVYRIFPKLGMPYSFYCGILLVGCVLFFRNMVLTIMFGLEATHYDWLFYLFFCGFLYFPAKIYFWFFGDVLTDLSDAITLSMTGFWRDVFKATATAAGVAAGAAVGTAIVTEAVTVVAELKQDLYTKVFDEGFDKGVEAGRQQVIDELSKPEGSIGVQEWKKAQNK